MYIFIREIVFYYFNICHFWNVSEIFRNIFEIFPKRFRFRANRNNPSKRNFDPWFYVITLIGKFLFFFCPWLIFEVDCDILTPMSLGVHMVDLMELVVAGVLECMSFDWMCSCQFGLRVLPFIYNKLSERKMLPCLFWSSWVSGCLRALVYSV